MKRAFAKVLWISAILLLALAGSALAEWSFAQKEVVIDLSVSDTAQLVLLENGKVKKPVAEWKSANPSVAVVAPGGYVTARKVGTAVIGVRPEGETEYIRCLVRVIDPERPVSVEIAETSLTLEVGERRAVSAKCLPETANQALVFSISNGKVASVSAAGQVIALSAGATTLTVRAVANPQVSRTIPIRVVSLPVPVRILLSPQISEVGVFQSVQLCAEALPVGVNPRVFWQSSDPTVLTVSETGLIFGVAPGRATVVAVSAADSSVSAEMTVQVFRAERPTGITLSRAETILTVGMRENLTAEVLPVGVAQSVDWTSSDEGVVTVDGGQLIARAPGFATVTVRSQKAPEVFTVCQVTVHAQNVSLVVPERRTSLAEMNQNIAKIDALRKSAELVVDAAEVAGQITETEAEDRKLTLERAFSMYAFPWMVKVRQPYWSKYYSENGLKDFRPGIVYYGLPYIRYSGDYDLHNREYDVSKALAEKRYYASGYGFYYLNQSLLLNNKYCGNDCSAFTGIAQQGVNSRYAFINTTSLLNTPLYRKITDDTAMLPGDTLCNGGLHVIMFLYYTNAERTEMMIVEQGGSDPDVNTINASIRPVSMYTGDGYIILRKAGYAQ